MLNTYHKLWDLLSLKERKQAVFLLFTMISYGALEMFGIVSIFPLVAVLTDPGLIEKNQLLNNIYAYLDFQSTENFLIFLTISVFIITVTRALYNGFLNHSILRYTQIRIQSLSTRLLQSYLNRPYIYFLGRHSADMGKSILSEVETVVYGSLVPSLDLISRSIISSFILIALFVAEPSTAIISLLTLSTSYAIIYALLRRYLLRKGVESIEANRNRFMIAQEALVGIKEIQVRDATNVYLQNFSKTTGFFHRIKINRSLVKLLPQLFIQISATGGILIFIIILLTKVEDNYNQIIPIVALYAFAGMRILPVIQGLFKNLTSIRGNKPALEILHRELTEYPNNSSKVNKNAITNFSNKISLENISFSYPDSKQAVINNLSLNIKAKTTVAFVGSTGAGKSTLIDLILGLLEPDQGNIRIDNIKLDYSLRKSWQKLIGYVPQSIFIADDTIAKNIALGLDQKDIDYDHIKSVARLANLDTFIKNDLPFGYETKVGEAGVKLSGGQRQRLGIARALYLNPKVLIFDEATSALDNLTEQKIMQSILNLKDSLTIIMIAHRLTTIKECDTIFHIKKGTLRSKGNFKELCENDEVFRDMASNLI